jgi:hypothetical protein
MGGNGGCERGKKRGAKKQFRNAAHEDDHATDAGAGGAFDPLARARVGAPRLTGASGARDAQTRISSARARILRPFGRDCLPSRPRALPHAPPLRPRPLRPAQVTKQRAQSGANGEIVSPRSLPAAGKSVVLLESAPTTTPIANRSSDWLFVVWYAIFWFTVMCVAADADRGVGDAGARGERRARWMTATDPVLPTPPPFLAGGRTCTTSAPPCPAPPCRTSRSW